MVTMHTTLQDHLVVKMCHEVQHNSGLTGQQSMCEYSCRLHIPPSPFGQKQNMHVQVGPSVALRIYSFGLIRAAAKLTVSLGPARDVQAQIPYSRPARAQGPHEAKMRCSMHSTLGRC